MVSWKATNQDAERLSLQQGEAVFAVAAPVSVVSVQLQEHVPEALVQLQEHGPEESVHLHEQALVQLQEHVAEELVQQ